MKIFNEQLSYLILDSHTESMQYFANKNACNDCSDNLQSNTVFSGFDPCLLTACVREYRLVNVCIV